MDLNTPVFRYTSLEAVVSIMRDRQLRLTRLDAFRDSFKGSVPKQQIDDQVPIFSGAQNAEMILAQHYPGYGSLTTPTNATSRPLARNDRAPESHDALSSRKLLELWPRVGGLVEAILRRQ